MQFKVTTPMQLYVQLLTQHEFAASFQTVYLATTVPQNIKGNKIMGRHTPTRSSLRHSRMLVISKDLRGELRCNLSNSCVKLNYLYIFCIFPRCFKPAEYLPPEMGHVLPDHRCVAGITNHRHWTVDPYVGSEYANSGQSILEWFDCECEKVK